MVNDLSEFDEFNPFGDDESEYIDISKKIDVSKDTEDYFLDRIEELERDNKLIRYEMNAIELPLFTKDKKIKSAESKKYIFNQNKDQYIEVVPFGDEKIPSVFDEKIFLAILRLHKEQGYNRTIYTNFYSLLKEAKLKDNGEMLKRIRASLERLAGTLYVFNNTFYSNEQGNIMNDKISTNIFSLRIIDFKEAQDAKPEMMKYFRNSKVKEIIQIGLSDSFYDNIIKKGYLYFDYEELLSIENSIARSLYAMITKWRKGDLYIKRHSRFLASRIPLSWKPNNIPKTIITIKNAFDELKSLNLIRDYKFSDQLKQQDSFIEIFFDKEHNKNYFKNRIGSEQEKMQIELILENNNTNNESSFNKEIKANVNEVQFLTEEKEIRLKELCEKRRKITFTAAKKEFIKFKSYDFEYLYYCLSKSIEKAEKVVPFFNKAIIDNYYKEEYESIKNEKKTIHERKKRQERIDKEIIDNRDEKIDLVMKNKTSKDYKILKEKVIKNLMTTVYKNKKREEMDEKLIEKSMRIWLEMEYGI